MISTKVIVIAFSLFGSALTVPLPQRQAPVVNATTRVVVKSVPGTATRTVLKTVDANGAPFTRSSVTFSQNVGITRTQTREVFAATATVTETRQSGTQEQLAAQVVPAIALAPTTTVLLTVEIPTGATVTQTSTKTLGASGLAPITVTRDAGITVFQTVNKAETATVTQVLTA